MEPIEFYSYLLTIGGMIISIGAVGLLAYSKREEIETQTLFQDDITLMSPGSPFIKPFRMHQNGGIEVKIELSKVYPSSIYQPYIHAYVTDLFSDTQSDIPTDPDI